MQAGVRSGRPARARRPPAAWVAGVMLAATTACGAGEGGDRALTAAERAPAPGVTSEPYPRESPPTHVDSIFPVEEALRRFRAAVGPEPAGLEGGATSRHALMDRFAQALAARDTAAFAGMVMSAAEFGWLYYPHTRYTSRPYQQAPDLVWLQIQNGSSRGLGRLLSRLGGTRLHVHDLQCPPEPLVEGPNRIWERCTVRGGSAGGETIEMRLFGSILERDGVFKFVSYTNDF
jgi:hypothetical protein